MSIRSKVAPRVVLIAGAAVAALLAATAFLGPAPIAPADDWARAEERPPFPSGPSLLDLEGEPVDLSGGTGSVIFLNFWATWCGPCLEEMPSMATLAERFAGRGLRIVAITDESADIVRAFVDRHEYPFEFVRDSGGRLASRLGVRVLPSTVIVDRRLRIVTFEAGARKWDAPGSVSLFDELLSER